MPLTRKGLLHWSRKALPGQLTTLALIAFWLHLAWELAQCQAFFIHLKAPPTWAGMLLAAGGDVVLTGIAFATIALLCRNLQWLRAEWGWLTWLGLAGSALALSVGVEKYALSRGRWAYTEFAPVIGEVSLVPILQLLLLFPLSFWLARKWISA